MKNICKLVNNPQIQISRLNQHSTMAPQIMLYFGVAKAIAQIKIFWLFCTSWNFIVKRFFSYNIHAARAWSWLGTTLNKENAQK